MRGGCEAGGQRAPIGRVQNGPDGVCDSSRPQPAMRYRGSERQNPHLQTAEAEAKMEMENGDAASNASAGFTDEPEAAQGAHMSRRERRRRLHSLEIQTCKMC